MPIARIIAQIVLSFFLATACQVALASPVKVESIQISPSETTVGTHPKIAGNVKAYAIKSPGETYEITVIAAVIQPDHVVKSWVWKNLSIRVGETRTFTIPQEYVVSLPGSYRVDFNIYSKNMDPLQRLSKTFTAADLSSKRSRKSAQKDNILTSALPSGHKLAEANNHFITPGTRNHIGIGGFVNTVNISGGPTLILWPLNNFALQGSYGVGKLTSYELRGFYRFDTRSMLKPYIGAGYLHAEKNFTATVYGKNVEGTITGNSYTLFGGLEAPFFRDRLALYVDVSGTPLKLSKDVLINASSVNVSVSYSPITIETGLIYYLW